MKLNRKGSWTNRRETRRGTKRSRRVGHLSTGVGGGMGMVVVVVGRGGGGGGGPGIGFVGSGGDGDEQLAIPFPVPHRARRLHVAHHRLSYFRKGKRNPFTFRRRSTERSSIPNGKGKGMGGGVTKVGRKYNGRHPLTTPSTKQLSVRLKVVVWIDSMDGRDLLGFFYGLVYLGSDKGHFSMLRWR